MAPQATVIDSLFALSTAQPVKARALAVAMASRAGNNRFLMGFSFESSGIERREVIGLSHDTPLVASSFLVMGTGGVMVSNGW
jgi:hypothetical protein